MKQWPTAPTGGRRNAVDLKSSLSSAAGGGSTSTSSDSLQAKGQSGEASTTAQGDASATSRGKKKKDKEREHGNCWKGGKYVHEERYTDLDRENMFSNVHRPSMEKGVKAPTLGGVHAAGIGGVNAVV